MNKLILIVFILLITTSCKSLQDTLTLTKKQNGDEFLVEKKSPLVLPPNYGKLPLPGDKEINTENNTVDNKNQTFTIPDQDNNFKSNQNSNNVKTSIENSILKKIK